MPDTPMIPPPDGAATGVPRLAAALSRAQGQIKPPKKSHVAKVPTKAGGSYSYRFSTLDELIESLRDPLARNGLAFTQIITNNGAIGAGKVGVETVILHDSGEQYACGLITLPAGETPQSIGSALTYARRYSLSAAFGVAAEDDDDGAEAERHVKPPAPMREMGDEPDDIAEAMGPDDREEPVAPSHAREQRLRAPNSGDTISEARQKRLFAIAKAHGWTNEAIKAQLTHYGFAHTRDIPVSKYDDIVSMFEEAAS